MKMSIYYPTILLLSFLLIGCEKDTDLLCDYVCFASLEKSKTYELLIGNRVSYKNEATGEVVHTNPDGLIILKGVDTKSLKPGQGLSSLNKNLNITLTGKYTVIETNGTEETKITKNIAMNTTTDKKGYFFFKIIHTTEPGMIISKVMDINFSLSAKVGSSKMVAQIDYSGGSLWSKMMGYLEALARYDISHGTYQCSADKCTWIDLGSDITLSSKS